MDTPFDHHAGDPRTEAAGGSARAWRRRFLMVHNARAGLARHAFLETVLARLAAAGADVLLVELDRTDEVQRSITDAIEAGGFDAVVAAGGDGTIRRLLPLLGGTSVPLGIVPLGTGNVLAHELGLPRRAGAVARTLLDGPVREVAGATANGAPFLLMCGVGLDGRIIASLDQGLKSRIGKLAYAWPVLSALSAPVDALEVEVDGREHFAAWAIVTNATHYGGRFVLTRRTHVCASGLQLVLFKGERRLDLARRLSGLALGRTEVLAARGGDVVSLPCRRVTIRAQRPAAVQLDGDPAESAPIVTVADTGPTLRLIVPSVLDGGRR
jgi:diacylglycerol kinase (ATP)